jgi:hypothetical protein
MLGRLSDLHLLEEDSMSLRILHFLNLPFDFNVANSLPETNKTVPTEEMQLD